MAPWWQLRQVQLSTSLVNQLSVSRWFVIREPGNPASNQNQNTPPATPRDATQATEDQRELQDQLDHRDDDPDAPGRHESRHQIADET